MIGLRLGTVVAILASAGAISAAGGPNFSRDVRPILSQHCFKCHGPDDAAREAKLRLDVRESAIARTDSGKPPIVPGKPDSSELIRRIFSHDADEMMPPPAANKPLSDSERRILRDWVSAGAEYKSHWAFVPPQQVPPPKVSSGSAFSRNPIDDFVQAQLESSGLDLKPSPPADRYTLARRVCLDLVGLPPTPDEADAFVNDPAPDAYERLVDRLLASPHYGERWARRWLDLARYADTNGYEKDRTRSIWPYRDWVIAAINADMPFDQFTIKQLAGDMLPNASLEDRIATGFHRNTMLNEEGGIDPLEYRYYATIDRVGTTGTVWLGLTVRCAQCHTHKFDPIPHRDYYRMMAFLNNADEKQIDIPVPALVSRRQQIERQIAAAEIELPNRFSPGGREGRAKFDAEFDHWEQSESSRALRWTVLHPTRAKATLPHLAVLPDDSILASGDMSKSDRYEVQVDKLPTKITALRLDVLPDESLPEHGPGRVFYEGPFGDFELSEWTAECDGAPIHFKGATQSYAANAGGASAAIDGNPLTSWSINKGQGKSHSATFILDRPLHNAKSLSVQMLFEYYYACGLGKFRISATDGVVPTDRRVMPAEVDQILAQPREQRTPEQRATLMRYFASITPALDEPRKELSAERAQEPTLPTTLVFAERPADNSRQTFVHKRGEFLQPKETVQAGIPSLFGSLPAEFPCNRLGFARWLVDARNPLVGRVTVNRQWQAFFGRGLVRTGEDFGYQGSLPTHPQLLDWLAVEFVRRGWSLMAAHRLIVTSATYRQASRVTPDSVANDPENKLLSRAPRVRLEAELVRDSALAAAGLLSERIGGPSVFPPQPASVSEGSYGGMTWNVSQGPDRFRRGLYTFSKRTSPFAMFATFDGPSGEECIARREVSNTPLQALTLLNDAQFVEIARGLAADVLTKSDGRSEQIARTLFRRCLVRPPDPSEVAALVTFYAQARARFETDPTGAQKIVSGAERVKSAGAGKVDPVPLAAWTLVARGLLNLDEAITRE
ncbi:MAG TPA: PSD1 and planctomycete cytochrome C domain-containing protein [Planctomycetaceae bacterium]|nr:PSD1 and planctomycete cytochrome C domain-containing protein [Planctomycetaceae bacterium]